MIRSRSSRSDTESDSVRPGVPRISLPGGSQGSGRPMAAGVGGGRVTDISCPIPGGAGGSRRSTVTADGPAPGTDGRVGAASPDRCRRVEQHGDGPRRIGPQRRRPFARRAAGLGSASSSSRRTSSSSISLATSASRRPRSSLAARSSILDRVLVVDLDLLDAEQLGDVEHVAGGVGDRGAARTAPPTPCRGAPRRRSSRAGWPPAAAGSTRPGSCRAAARCTCTPLGELLLADPDLGCLGQRVEQQLGLDGLLGGVLVSASNSSRVWPWPSGARRAASSSWSKAWTASCWRAVDLGLHDAPPAAGTSVHRVAPPAPCPGRRLALGHVLHPADLLDEVGRAAPRRCRTRWPAGRSRRRPRAARAPRPP